MELLGIEALPRSVDCVFDEQVRGEDGTVCTRFEYRNLLGEAVPAMLCVPEGSQDALLPGVVCLPGTSASAAELMEKDFGCDPQRKNRLVGWSRELARRGFATVAITLCGCVGRRSSAEEWLRRVLFLAPYGRSLTGVMVDEALRAARILAGDNAVDERRVGVAGFSLGGQMAWWAAALDPSLRATASLCGSLGSLEAVLSDGEAQRRHGPHFYVPHLLRHFDHGKIINACVAPRPLMVLAPTEDEDMPKSGVDELARQVAPAYENAGARSNLSVLQPEGRHAFTQDYFETVSAWLQDKLGLREA